MPGAAQGDTLALFLEQNGFTKISLQDAWFDVGDRAHAPLPPGLGLSLLCADEHIAVVAQQRSRKEPDAEVGT